MPAKPVPLRSGPSSFPQKDFGEETYLRAGREGKFREGCTKTASFKAHEKASHIAKKNHLEQLLDNQTQIRDRSVNMVYMQLGWGMSCRVELVQMVCESFLHPLVAIGPFLTSGLCCKPDEQAMSIPL